MHGSAKKESLKVEERLVEEASLLPMLVGHWPVRGPHAACVFLSIVLQYSFPFAFACLFEDRGETRDGGDWGNSLIDDGKQGL
jgi:hypothetical protein